MKDIRHWDRELETMDPRSLEKLRLQRLREIAGFAPDGPSRGRAAGASPKA